MRVFPKEYFHDKMKKRVYKIKAHVKSETMDEQRKSTSSTFSLLDVIGNEVLSNGTTLASEDADFQDASPPDSILCPDSERIEKRACKTASPKSHSGSSQGLEKEKDEPPTEVFTKESLDLQKGQSGLVTKLCDVTVLQRSMTDGTKTITVVGNDELPLETSGKDHRGSPGKSTKKILIELASGRPTCTCVPPGKHNSSIMNQPNTKDKVEHRSSLLEGDVDQIEDHSRQTLEKIPDQPNEKDNTNVTLTEGADQIKVDGDQISDQQANENALTSRQHARETVKDVGDENGTMKTTDDVAQAENKTSSRNTIGRVIMIDGIKFVAVTCLQPPKGHCRTCNTFGSLLYFSARTCYILEAAEKFCSVQCARKFINKKRCRPTPSSQPSGDVQGCNVSTSKLKAPKDQRDMRRSGNLSKFTSSGAKDVKKKEGWKSKLASRNAQTLENIYIDSLVIKKVDKSRSPKKKANQRNLTKQDTYRSLTPPLPRQLGESTLKMASKSETSVADRSPKAFDKRLQAKSCEAKAIKCQEMEIASKKSGRKKKASQERRTSAKGEPPSQLVGNQVNTTLLGILSRPKGKRSFKGHKGRLSFPPILSTVWKRDDLRSMFRAIGSKRRQAGEMSNVSFSSRTPSVKRSTLEQRHRRGGSTTRSNEREVMATVCTSSKPLHNLKKGSPSKSKTKVWKKCGKELRSQSCEFLQQDLLRATRECDTPEPTSKGLFKASQKKSTRRSMDTGMSLNQFHERRRSLFKTMFPFQKTLGQPKIAQGSGKGTSPRKKTPCEPSVAEDCSDVATSATVHSTTAPGSPNPILGDSGIGSKAKVGGNSGCKIAQRIRKEDKPNADKQRSNWSNLFQYVMEAADRKEVERRKESNNCGEDHCATVPGPSAKDLAMAHKTETTVRACSQHAQVRLSGDTTEGRIQDNSDGQEKRRKKKKKKKMKRKRKKEKRSRHHDFQDIKKRRDLKKKQLDAQTQCMRKGKDKKRRGGHVSESPSSSESDDDPEAWPKWRGDGNKKMDMMTSIDHLIWTMKNKFQPDIGRSSTARGSANLSTNLINSA